MNTPSTIRPEGAAAAKPRPTIKALTQALDPPLFDRLFPGARLYHRIIAVAIFVAIIVVGSKLRFYLPDNPTPITLQTFAILTAAGVMGFRWGIATVVAYLAVGATGFLAFANQPWGWSTPAEAWTYITGVTGGYLVGFILASALAGALSQRGFGRANSLWANVAATLVVYLPAIAWLAVNDFGWPADGELFMQAMYV